MLSVLLETVRKHWGKKADFALIRKAFAASHDAHFGQFRKSTEPYFYHPYEVARTAAEYGCDSKTIAGCLLHDCLEDTLLTEKELRKKFGKDIASIVVGLTKFAVHERMRRDERQREYLRRAIEFSVRDPRVVIIKLFDKLHNSRTAMFLEKKKRLAFVREVWQRYVPLAHRLGIHKLKYELEDAVLDILKPKEFPELRKKIMRLRREKSIEIKKMISALKPKLKGFEFRLYWKGFGTIYTKVFAGKKEVSRIYDSEILLVLANSEADCYRALGVIHSVYNPLPFKFKDFIAIPEFGIYRSLHTVVVGPSGKPVKVYIRTNEMNVVAQRGIIALLESGGKSAKELLNGKINWMKSVLEENEEDFSERIGMDNNSQRVFIFSPKGEAVNLLSGSTALDYAYQIHSDLGRRAIGAKVNGKSFPLKKRLPNACTVKIIVSAKAKPKPEMLSWAITPKAKREIRGALEARGKKAIPVSNPKSSKWKRI